MTRRLLDNHRDTLERESAIDADVLEERGWFSITEQKELEPLGFGRSNRFVPTLVAPIHGVIADEPPWFMQRPDVTPIKEGRPRKYLIPHGRRMGLDIHPRVRENLANPDWPLFITEGPKKVDALVSAGAQAVVGLAGVWNWRGRNGHDGKTLLPDWEWVALKDGRTVYVVYDSDVAIKEPVRLAMDRLGAALSRSGAHVAFVYLPSGPGGAKVGADDYLAKGGTLEELVALATTTLRRPAAAAPARKPVEPVAPVALGDAVDVFQRWLHLPDPEALYVLWGAIAANRLPGDPVWLLLVDASGGGKTEAVRACGDLPECAHISALTEAGLLSGTAAAERSDDATGGVLRLIGARGVIVAKDFTSVLAMERDSRGRVLAALREVYDGSWVRPLGVDGGRQLEWEGKAGFVGGVTHEIDRQHTVMARMGERLLLYRLPERGSKDIDRTVTRALSNRAVIDQMRADLRRAALGVFAGLPQVLTARSLADEERDWLVKLAKFVALARAGVDRDYKGDVTEVIPPEMPTRLAMQLDGLLAGMDVLGIARPVALRAVTNTAFGCIPALRRRALEELLRGELSTTDVTAGLRLPNRSVRRALEALTGHHLVTRDPQGQGKPDLWTLAPDARATLEQAVEMTSVTGTPTGDGLSGKVPAPGLEGGLPEIPGPPYTPDIDADEDDDAYLDWAEQLVVKYGEEGRG